MGKLNQIRKAIQAGRNDGSIFDKYAKMKSLENHTQDALDRKIASGIKASTKPSFYKTTEGGYGVPREKYNDDIRTLENRLKYAQDQQNAIAYPQEQRISKANQDWNKGFLNQVDDDIESTYDEIDDIRNGLKSKIDGNREEWRSNWSPEGPDLNNYYQYRKYMPELIDAIDVEKQGDWDTKLPERWVQRLSDMKRNLGKARDDYNKIGLPVWQWSKNSSHEAPISNEAWKRYYNSKVPYFGDK